MAEIGATLAAAFRARCDRRGLEPDSRLRLLAHDNGRTTSTPATPPGPPTESLGVLHERLVSAHEQTARGAWYTPRWLADDLVVRVVDDETLVADPACGGGVFLLSAADRLLALGADPHRIVTELIWGADLDPLAVAVCEAELWSWSAEHGTPVVPSRRLVVGDALVDVEIPTAGAVVGNPPFLGQLKSATSSDGDRRRALARRWGDAMRPYTDVSWLFLLAAVEAVGPGGSVALVMPQSVLGARDAGAVRERIDARAALDDCWIDEGKAFAAAVDVCAPILRTPRPDDAPPNQWLASIGGARGIPPVTLDHTTGTLSDRATVVAGFRDEYYGLVDAIIDGGSGPRLMTSGAIDPLRPVDAPVRFAKRRWDTPTVDASKATGRAVRWLDAQDGPKLLVASQTKVLEAVVDVDGSMVGGVPALVVRPHDFDDLWALAAAIHAPSVSAWMLQQTIGTGLSADTCRPTADLVSRIPLPTDLAAWASAAQLARSIAAGNEDWDDFAVVADEAYGRSDSAVRNWWLSRIPLR